jgi:uncharacterized membrane protein
MGNLHCAQREYVETKGYCKFHCILTILTFYIILHIVVCLILRDPTLSTNLLQNPIITQLIMLIIQVHGTLNFIAVLRTARHCTLTEPK